MMSLFSQLVAWTNYFASELVTREVEETMIEAERKVAEARFLAASPKRITDARIERDSQEDPRLAALADKHLTVWGQRKALEMQLQATERVANLISRELTRRGQQAPIQRRNARWNP